MNRNLENFDEFDALFLLCEGPSEVTIMNILLRNNLLKFTYEDLESFEPLHVRSASDFERDYLNKSIGTICVIRVIDSKNHNVLKFNLSKAYKDKLTLVNCVTSPEIEMLMIINRGKYDEYKKKYSSKLKPSEYVKNILKIRNPKCSSTIEKEFSEPEKLVVALKEYTRITKKIKNIDHISDLLNTI